VRLVSARTVNRVQVCVCVCVSECEPERCRCGVWCVCSSRLCPNTAGVVPSGFLCKVNSRVLPTASHIRTVRVTAVSPFGRIVSECNDRVNAAHAGRRTLEERARKTHRGRRTRRQNRYYSQRRDTVTMSSTEETRTRFRLATALLMVLLSVVPPAEMVSATTGNATLAVFISSSLLIIIICSYLAVT